MVEEVVAYMRCRKSGAEHTSTITTTTKTGDGPASGIAADAANDELKAIQQDAVYLDATLGTAGHTLAILEADPDCRVIALDRDEDSMQIARQRLEAAQVAHRVTLVHGDFRHASELLRPFLENQKVATDGRPIRHISGALIDAGMSLYQVTWAERGLSFRADAPLDMRYDRAQEVSAYDLVNRLSALELEDLLFKFSDERWARRIAANIVEQRRHQPIRTTAELASLVEAAIPAAVRHQSRVHPATKTFAALRLAVNDEFWALDQGVWSISSVLANAARLVVLTYSSNEDRTVKRTFRRLAGRPLDGNNSGTIKRPRQKRRPDALSLRNRAPGSARSPLTFSLSLPTDETWQESGQASLTAASASGWGETWGMKIVTPKPVVPSREEIARNALARSCKLRAIEKFTMN
jgi:16S rRNA (cytosine1402-N4)-methyltransferase